MRGAAFLRNPMKIRKRNRLRLRKLQGQFPRVVYKTEAWMWRDKRARQAASIASGVDGRWFREGETRNWKLIDSPL